jgi:hypothetical protein
VTLLVLRNDDNGGDRVATVTSTSSSSTTTSSTTTTSTTTTTTVAVSSTTAAPSTTTAPPTTVALPVVTGQGAVLQPASETRTTPLSTDCEALGDPGWTVTCGSTAVRGGVMAWLVETKPTADGRTARRALVFRRGVGQEWHLVLRASDDAGTQFANVRVRVEDLSGDGAKEIAYGFTRPGASAVLAVDVIEGTGPVAVHRELQKGAARVSTGQLDTWRRTDGSHFAHEVIQFRDGAWRIVASASVAPSDVPPSQL